MSDPKRLKRNVIRELALLLILFFAGFVLLPIGIYWVGDQIFGNYGEGGYWDFFGRISSEVRSFNPTAWLLILSPYLVWQLLRFTIRGFRHKARMTAPEPDPEKT